MDTLQLVSGKQVQVFTLKKGFNDTILYDETKVIERFGFKPALLPDYKGLRGDTSDNIIGIAGIGEKTGMTLVQTFGTIEKMYKVLSKDETPFKEVGITPRIIELLKNGEDEALFSKTLATIRRDVPISFALPLHTFKEGIDLQKIETLFRELEFRTLINRVKSSFTDTASEVVETKEDTNGEVYNPDTVKQLSIALWLLNSELTNPTIDDILQELEDARQKALSAETPQCSAAVTATMSKAKLLGLDKQVIEHKGTLTPVFNFQPVKPVQDLTEDELSAELAKYGIDLRANIKQAMKE